MNRTAFFLIATAIVYSQDCNQNNWQQYSPHLQYCDLEDVNIAWEDLSGFDFFGANLTNSNLTGSNFSGANLSSAVLINADLTWTTLVGANFSNANLSGAGLGAADFTGANLFGANLTGTTIFNTNFTNACIQGVVNFPIFGYIGEPIFDGCGSNDNAAPIANSTTLSLDEDTALTIVLSGSDIDEDPLNYLIVGSPTNGTISLLDNTATYIPSINFSGIDSFQFIVNDGEEDSNLATVTLVINAVNDAPYLYAIDNTSITEGEIFSYNLQAEDVDGDVLIYATTISGGNAIVNIDGSVLTIEPQESSATLNIVVTVSDGSATHSVSFFLTILQQQTTCLDNNNDGWCDHFPIITLNEGSVLLFEKEEDVEYEDPGAHCYDNEDGDISHLVEVGGQIVNVAIPNMYEITYNCADMDSNAAQTLTRTVVIVPTFISDENEDGLDDDAFVAGAQSGDANMDGALNVVDIVIFINAILTLNGE